MCPNADLCRSNPLSNVCGRESQFSVVAGPRNQSPLVKSMTYNAGCSSERCQFGVGSPPGRHGASEVEAVPFTLYRPTDS